MLPDSWKLLLAGVACGSSYSSSKRRISTSVSFFTCLVKNKGEEVEVLTWVLHESIAPLHRGADVTLEDRQRVDQTVRKPEAVNKVKEPLKSELLNGKWELLYTTLQSLLQTQATANLVPLNAKSVTVKFDSFRIAGLIPIKNPGSGRGQLEITYLDDELRHNCLTYLDPHWAMFVLFAFVLFPV